LIEAQRLLALLGVSQREGITTQRSRHVAAQPATIAMQVKVVLTIQTQQRYGLIACFLLDETQGIKAS